MKRQTKNKDVKSNQKFFLSCVSGSIKKCVLTHKREGCSPSFSLQLKKNGYKTEDEVLKNNKLNFDV